ncbi:MAG: energy transducer TonB [Candidatus Acidiferrales bacterium]
MTFSQDEFQPLALRPLEIIWPQVLDGPISGEASYRLTIDSSGSVSDVEPLTIAVERSNDSVSRQVMRWKFKPPEQNGAPVQAEVVWTFDFNTRAYGPSAPLTEAEARNLATGAVDPDYPPGIASGTACSLRIAVDSDGYLIEVIEDACPRELASPCLDAIRKWHFSPILENGEPRPYRASITFRAP